MISKLLSVITHLSAIWCALVVAGFTAKLLWISMMMGWGLM